MYIQDFDEAYEKYTIAGFGDGVVNGNDMYGVPYIKKYGDDIKGYAWNCNNYIRTETVRVVDERK